MPKSLYLIGEQGKELKTEIWLLKDTREDVSADVEVELKLDGKSYRQFQWYGEMSTACNAIGPSVNVRLANARCDLLTLLLKAGEYSSEYCLFYTGMWQKKEWIRSCPTSNIN